jgi:hypothetical protein
MLTDTQCRKSLHDYCKQLADETFAEYHRMISPVLYLYGQLAPEGPFDDKTISGTYIELKLSRDRLPGFQLVICGSIPRNITVDSLKVWFIDHLKREPILNCI